MQLTFAVVVQADARKKPWLQEAAPQVEQGAKPVAEYVDPATHGTAATQARSVLFQT